MSRDQENRQELRIAHANWLGSAKWHFGISDNTLIRDELARFNHVQACDNFGQLEELEDPEAKTKPLLRCLFIELVASLSFVSSMGVRSLNCRHNWLRIVDTTRDHNAASRIAALELCDPNQDACPLHSQTLILLALRRYSTRPAPSIGTKFRFNLAYRRRAIVR